MNDVENCSRALEECLRTLSNDDLRRIHGLFVQNGIDFPTTFNYRSAVEVPQNDVLSRAILAVFHLQLCANVASARILVEREVVRRFFNY